MSKRQTIWYLDTALPSVSVENELEVKINKSADVRSSQNCEQITKSVDAIPSQSCAQKLRTSLSVKELIQQFEIQTNVNEESSQGYNNSDQENSSSALQFDSNSKQEHLTTLSNVGFEYQVPSPSPSNSGSSAPITQDPLLDCYGFATNTPRHRFSIADPTSTTMIASELKRNSTLEKTVLEEDKKQLKYAAQELIDTERSYVQNMLSDIDYFEMMFLRSDCPSKMHSQKEHLFGPIKQIALLHRDKLLPVLPENPYNLTTFLEEFLKLIENNSMYLYVSYAINKRRSQAVADNFKRYLEYYENLSDRKLGIQSLLLQPIQRLMRYPLLLKGILKNSYSTLSFIKPCMLLINAIENKLISVANEAYQLNDIFELENLNISIDDSKFHKVLDAYIEDMYELQCNYLNRYQDKLIGYPGKLFIFDKYIIYTEQMEGGLKFRDCFSSSEEIVIFKYKKSFGMYQVGGKYYNLNPIHPNTVELSLKYLEILTYEYKERDSGLGLD